MCTCGWFDSLFPRRKEYRLDDCGAFALCDVLEEDLSFGLQLHDTLSSMHYVSHFTFRKLVTVLLTSRATLRLDGVLWNMIRLMQDERTRTRGVFHFLGIEQRDDQLLCIIITEAANFLKHTDSDVSDAQVPSVSPMRTK